MVRGRWAGAVRRLCEAGDIDGASASPNACSHADPRDAFALHVLGLVRFSQGDAAAGDRVAATLARSAPGRRRPVGPRRDAAHARTLRGGRGGIPRALRIDPSSGARRWAISATSCSTSIAPVKRKRRSTEALQRAPDQPWLLRSLALSLTGTRRVGPRRGHRCGRRWPSIRRMLKRTRRWAHCSDRAADPIEAEAHHRAALPRLQRASSRR